MDMSSMTHGNQRTVSVRMRIIKLIVMNSGTYNQMYFRPYQTHYDIDIQEDLARRLHDNAGKTTTSLMAGIANRIMMPAQQHSGPVPIVNGWDTPRARFNMVIESSMSNGTVYYYQIQGYTDHYTTSLTGKADPDMMFYVNSYIRSSRTSIMTPTGLKEQDIVTESAQVINGRLTKNMMGQQDLFGMRPNEMYNVMQADYLRNTSYEPDMPLLRDDRFVLSNTAVPNKRSNNLPANILSRMVDSWQTANSMLEYGTDRADVYGRSKGYTTDGYLMENPFFRQLAASTGVPEAASFRLRDLIQMDRNVTHPSITSFITLDSRGMANLNQAGQASYWHDPSDKNAWVASAIISSIPTIMMEMMLTRLSFTANNHDHAGHNHVMITGAKDMMGRDFTQSLEVFKHRLIHEVMYDITYGNSETYMLSMAIDLMGDTVIDIKYGNNPMTRFVAPSFCDALLSPVLTPDESILRNNVDDISQMLSGVTSINQHAMVNETI